MTLLVYRYLPTQVQNLLPQLPMDCLQHCCTVLHKHILYNMYRSTVSERVIRPTNRTEIWVYNGGYILDRIRRSATLAGESGIYVPSNMELVFLSAHNSPFIQPILSICISNIFYHKMLPYFISFVKMKL